MRDHSKHIEVSRTQAVAAMLDASALGGLEGKPTETVPLDRAFGRVLACDVRSRTLSPTCLTCNMDSIAVRWDDFADGMPDTSAWVRGVNWEFANTGVAMPEGFDTAIVIEHVTVSEDEQQVAIAAAPSARFAGTRQAGEKMQVGDMLAKASDIVTPDTASRIGSGNVSQVQVLAKPRVAFIPTGNELMAPGVPYVEGPAFAGYGKNFETNSLLVQGRVEAWGGTYLGMDIVPDDPQLIKEAILEATAMADIVVLNAGSSKGSDDWSCEQMEELGQVLFHETNHGPGHHSSFALVGGTPVVGISGPSAGASFTLDFYLRPLIMDYLGQPTEPRTVPARLTEPFPTRPHKGAAMKKLAGEKRPDIAKSDDFFNVKAVDLTFDETGTLLATPVAGHMGSPAVAHAKGMYMVPGIPEQQPQAGDVIFVELRF